MPFQVVEDVEKFRLILYRSCIFHRRWMWLGIPAFVDTKAEIRISQV
jgi:hypothetical protein